MIDLNFSTGVLQIDRILLHPHKTLDSLKESANNYPLTHRLTNDVYSSYSISNVCSGEFSLFFFFFKNELNSVMIQLGQNYDFPPFEISDEEKSILREVISSIGGENKYEWGSVELSEDRKGGILSILIKYN